MIKQTSEYFDSFLSKCEFRKGFSAQHCLLSMLEKWKSAIDHRKMFDALVSDLLLETKGSQFETAANYVQR